MIIFLYGSDSWRRNRKLAELLATYRQKNPQIDLLIADLEEDADNWLKVRDFVEQPSMFVDSKVAVVRESGLAEDKEWRKFLRSQLKTEKTFLIIADSAAPKADFRFLKEKAFSQQSFEELAGAELTAWAKKEAGIRNLSFQPAAWQFLINYFNSWAEGRSWLVFQELEKLSLAGLNQPIALADLRLVVDWFSTEDFQALLNPLFNSGDWRRRLFLAEKLMLQKEDSAHIFNALAFRSHGSQLVKFADYDIMVKSGLADYESAIFDFAISAGI